LITERTGQAFVFQPSSAIVVVTGPPRTTLGGVRLIHPVMYLISSCSDLPFLDERWEETLEEWEREGRRIA